VWAKLWQEREAGQTEAVVKRQLAAVIHLNGHCISEIVVAYEPVWAIGTGRTASPEQAQQVHAVLRAQLAAATPTRTVIRVLYGGSMNAANAGAIAGSARHRWRPGGRRLVEGGRFSANHCCSPMS
jgi:triosephosphate isomerase